MPFEIPDNWVWTTLGEVGTWQSGGTPSRSNKSYYGGNIPWLKTGDLNDGLISDIPESITEEAVASSSAKINPTGSVLIAMYGATIGKLGILTFPATTNQACCACIEFNAITQLYLFYFLLSQRSTFISKGGGGAQPNISKEIIVNTFIPLPPLSEQQRIIMEIEKWFALIDQIEQGRADLQTTIKQTKNKILDLAIHGKLVPQDMNDEPAIEQLKRINPDFIPCDNRHSGKLPYKIPKTWVWCSHNSILDISGGSQPAKSYFETIPKPNCIRLYQIRDYGESPVPVYIPINLASKQTKKGDILLARYGGSLGKVFYAEQGAYNVAMAKVIFKFENLIYKEFAYYYYLSDLYQGKLKEISRTAQTGFNITDFNDMYFPLPPINEQQRIVQKMEKLFSSLDDIQKNLEV
ncbi:type I restriction modification DNA specificity domain protein [Bacteroides sp. 2_2_4]|uniref:restriction endonuclease subunit S n=1 Tax=Bacteroides sp. 2_2_4 TaxID=469590 RepID=UPI0001A23AE6|nr:restriction endonuclease subunit S [Bacteroides sp. 2_2_4]EEO55228.1 type I restriction modification DNA specificity domain protein [Bacteroides sp. 2_2_4]